ncbi:ribonuclease HII [Corynebacterium ulcerans]|uniref:Ribonuclease HII n=1 Tax=Corynebacterium ulcerans TaxID=65058 RepID=A0ABD0BLG5_CORUL|nr:ribonuclease HII [Corynebacterium ulcerans]BAM27752.1 ribonuclease HII [Corynebacterium ulcerans 0102]OIS07973.1 ribonuclease HII [Corynebacterium ulcerans]QGZ25770.1 ribonuclease HII [Corynebacterium ulcerans]BBJ72395.1 ribonuclease HII [Corynebacterium ulcerans]
MIPKGQEACPSLPLPASQGIKIRKLKYLRTFEGTLEKWGLGPVAGIDEAGRGSCCGPITIAACILPPRPIAALATLTDSKKLSPRMREELYPLIKKHAVAWSILHIPASEIDAYGIQHANISGMRRAVALLSEKPGYALIDAMRVPGLPCPSLPVIGGDAAARCIAAASVLAKQSRDELMIALDKEYPGYGLGDHKGYGTKSHIDAVRRHGGTPEHRYSYANVRAAHEEWAAENKAVIGR